MPPGSSAPLGERGRAEADRGVSLAYSFDAPNAPSRRTTQYFEMLGNRAIYHDGWLACTTPPIPPWDPNTADVDPIDGYKWELYHVARISRRPTTWPARSPRG